MLKQREQYGQQLCRLLLQQRAMYLFRKDRARAGASAPLHSLQQLAG